jgi:UDP-N-acetylglucosamine/UDP-N-acetylgalactosamine diphosphorylase
MGSGAQVREGCLLEEEANGAHCVGLKQTILFPFVTLGSLINFCDCLMAGGTSRKDHSEVGSSYIHFNFTPEGDKTTASLIGDVPRGVMLNQKAIFLGGQGGIVGPLRLGYGNVVAANSVLRNDVPEDNKLVVGKTYSGKVIDYRARAYPNLRRIIEANFLYLANLTALEQWYLHVRRRFFDTREFGSLVFEGAMNTLVLAKKERLNRLKVLAEKVKLEADQTGRASLAAGAELFSNMPQIEDLFSQGATDGKLDKERDGFLAALEKQDIDKGQGYIAVIQALPTPVSQQGTAWLQSIVDFFCEQAAKKVMSIKSYQ